MKPFYKHFAPVAGVLLSIVCAFGLMDWQTRKQAERFASDFKRHNLAALAAGDVLSLSKSLEQIPSATPWTCLVGEYRGETFYKQMRGRCREGLWSRGVVVGLKGNSDASIYMMFQPEHSAWFVALFLLAGQGVLLLLLRRSGQRMERVDLELEFAREREQFAADRAVAQTIQMVVHDVRRPFAVLRAGLDLLSRAQDGSEIKSILSKLIPETQESARSVYRLTADILMTRRGNGVRDESVLDPRDILDQAVRDVTKAGMTDHVHVHRHYEGHNKFQADELQISRVFANILENAFDAINLRKSEMVLLTTRDCEGGIEFTISNTGSSIAKERMASIFDAYATYGKASGSGLGLYIAKKVVEFYGGTISCRSYYNEFICNNIVEFRIWLPACSVSACEQNYSVSGPQQDIAVIDDSLICLEHWRRQLGQRFRVHTFASPEEFLALILAQPTVLGQFRAIVVDYYFAKSESTGLKLAQRLKEILPTAKVILSSEACFKEIEMSHHIDAQIGKWPTDLLGVVD